MTAAQAFGVTVATLVAGVPLAVVSLVAAIYVHEAIETRRYRRHPDGTHEPDETKGWVG